LLYCEIEQKWRDIWHCFAAISHPDVKDLYFATLFGVFCQRSVKNVHLTPPRSSQLAQMALLFRLVPIKDFISLDVYFAFALSPACLFHISVLATTAPS
jgi:hypothetical protein